MRVTWLDATKETDDVRPDGRIGVVCQTVGWCLRDDSEGVVVAVDRSDPDHRMGFTIPSAYVQEIVDLVPAKSK